ncbi:MAG: hypothetical protein ABI968_13165 [Acidobacteriota bacterium]
MTSDDGGDSAQDLLRHTLATLAYRGGKALRGAPASFAEFRIAEGTRTPGAILAHIGDLMDWALALAQGKNAWKDSQPLPWEREVDRFFEAVRRVDAYLASGAELVCPPNVLFQGPIADALTHFGQIAMLRRLSGSPVKGENYVKADIATGRVGSEQTTPNFEFD